MFGWTFDVESERLIAMSVSLSIDLPLLSDVTESVQSKYSALQSKYSAIQAESQTQIPPHFPS